MKISSDFRDLLTLLNECEVRYLIVGGYALAAHGFPRNTKDIDVFYEASPDNAARLMTALERFGFGEVGLSVQDFNRCGQIVQLGFPPDRIDLISTISGVEFAEAWNNRIRVTLDGVEMPIISRSDFLRNKRASGRLTDLADAERLGEQTGDGEQ